MWYIILGDSKVGGHPWEVQEKLCQLATNITWKMSTPLNINE